MFKKRRKRNEQPGATITAAVSSGLAAENKRLQQAVMQLSLLNDLAQAVGLSDSSETMIAAIVHRAKQALSAEQVMIYLMERDGGEDLLKTRMREDSTRIRHTIHFDVALCGTMAHRISPFRTSDPRNEPLLTGVKFDPDLRSLLCVPLLVRGKLKGVVTACNKHDGDGFTEEDQRLLAIMANQSAQVLENTRLREEEEAYANLRHDVELAREIQAALLPRVAPKLAGYDIAGCSVPAETVGGDYFDYIPLADGRLAICLGDVSGKGIPASLLMANLQATLRGQAHLSSSARDCVARSNHLLYESTSVDKFATLFYGILDPKTHQLTYCNAGHERPLLLSCTSEGECKQELAEGGLVLGVVDETEYAEGCVSMEPDSLLLIFSDGLTDVVNAVGQPFDLVGVERVLRGLKGASAAEIREALLDAVKQHGGSLPPFDDVTLVAVRRPR